MNAAATPGPVREFLVGADGENLRLDQFLVGVCEDLSRSRIQTDMASELVTVDAVPRAKGFRLKAGQVVRYAPAVPVAMQALPQDIPLDIVHQDEHLVVINKPVGLVVHPAVGHPDGTLVNALLHRFGNLPAAGNPLRPGIVHRLDRDTSGLMVVALTDEAHRRLAAQIEAREVGRVYQALSWGAWAEPAGRLTGAIGRHPRFRQKMAVVERRGREAATRYQVIDDFGFVQLCRVELETGRTHQIRVHFAYNGHPVVGDALYGEDKRARGIHNLDRRQADWMVKAATRQMLHAAELRLVHPLTGQEMIFIAQLPSDMARVLAGLRERAERG